MRKEQFMKKVLSKLMGVLAGTLVVVCISGCGKDTAYYIDTANTEITADFNAQSQTEEESTDGNSEAALLYIYVCGAIQNPGVYTMPEGSRICDVFQKAGGLTSEAAVDYWNQARVLVDGEMIYVPTAKEVEDRGLNSGDTANTNEDNDNKININTASKEELMTIPGIGEAKALAIIAYREANGSFSSIEEVKNVEGIKDGVFSKMKDYIEID